MGVRKKSSEAISVPAIARHSEDESLAIERRLLRVLEAARIIPWEADPQTWRFTYVGSQAERIMGYPHDQWYEKDFWVSHIFSEDREFATNICETSCKTLSDFEFQYRMVKADGDVIWLRDIVNVEFEDGVPQVLRGYMIDITAVKRLEKTLKNDHDLLTESLQRQSFERLRRVEENNLVVIETIPHGIEEIDTSGLITFANSALHKQYEYGAGKLIGRSICDFVAESSEREELRGYLNFLVETQPTPTPYFGKKRTRSGKVIDVEVAWNYKRDPQGQLIGFTSVITDITARKRAQEALRQSHDKLEHRVQNRTKELRVANEKLETKQEQLRKTAKNFRRLAGKLIEAQEDERRRIGRELHDGLTQSLAAMASDAGRLEQQAEATEDRNIDGLRKIREGLVESSEYVHSLSRQLHPAIVEDLGIADALHSLCEEFEQNEGVRIDCQADGIPAALSNDQALCIYRVAQEALRNIVKHSRATQTQVHLRSKNGTVKLQVRDNGVGFDMNEVKKRNGLGLHSIEERAWLVGGTVRVETGPGDGTVISVSLPLT